MTEKITKSLKVSGLLAFLVFMSALTIYLGNLRDYTFTIQQLAVVAGAFSFGIWACVFLLLACFFRSKIFSSVLLAVLAFALCLWVQGSFLLWPLGGDNTTIHTFAMHPVFGALELVIFGLIFWLVFHFRLFSERKTASLAGIVVFTQILAILPALSAYRESSLDRLLYIYPHVKDQIHRVSDQPNLFIILADSMERNYFQAAWESAEPEMNAVLKDFEYFPHFLSLYPQTFYAVPTLLSGSDYFDRTKKWDVNKTVFEQTEENYFSQSYRDSIDRMYTEPNALLPNLEKAGFRCEVYPLCGTAVYLPGDLKSVSNLNYDEDQKEKSRFLSLRVLVEKIIPHALYRMSPLITKPVVFSASNAFLREAYRLKSGEYWLDENTAAEVLADSAVTPAPNSENADDSEFLSHDSLFFSLPTAPQLTNERYAKVIHLNGLHALDGMSDPARRMPQTFGKVYFVQGIGSYLNYLKQAGCYDASWIVIFGDHGLHSSPVADQFNPALLIKRPNSRQEKMTENDSIVLMRDLAPSLLSEMGIQTSAPFSLWHPTEEQSLQRKKLWEDFIIKNSP